MEINWDTQKVSLQWQVISSEHTDQLHCAVKYFSQLIHTFFCRYFCRSLSQLHQWFFSCWGAVVVSRTNRNIITSPSSQTKNHFFPNLDFPTWLAAREIFEIFLVAGISPASGPQCDPGPVHCTALPSYCQPSTVSCHFWPTYISQIIILHIYMNEMTTSIQTSKLSAVFIINDQSMFFKCNSMAGLHKSVLSC